LVNKFDIKSIKQQKNKVIDKDNGYSELMDIECSLDKFNH